MEQAKTWRNQNPKETHLTNRRGIVIEHLDTNEIKAQMDLRIEKKKLQPSVIIDSGSTRNVISRRYVEKHGIPSRPVNRPLIAKMTNGEGNKITHLVEMRYVHLPEGPQTRVPVQQQKFYVTDLHSEDIMLGMDYLRNVNPQINWTEDMIPGKIITWNVRQEPVKILKITRIRQTTIEEEETPMKEDPPYEQVQKFLQECLQFLDPIMTSN